MTVEPRVAKVSTTLALLLLVTGCASLLSAPLVRELAFAPFTLVSSPWRVVTGLTIVPSLGPIGLALVIVPFWMAARSLEFRRGAAPVLVVTTLAGLAGFVLLFVISSPERAGWTTASGTIAAATAGLAVSAWWPVQSTRTIAAWSTGAVAGLSLVGVVLLGVAPVWQLLGGLIMGILIESVYALVPRPQRHPLPLFIGLGGGVLVLVLAVVLRLFIGN